MGDEKEGGSARGRGGKKGEGRMKKGKKGKMKEGRKERRSRSVSYLGVIRIRHPISVEVWQGTGKILVYPGAFAPYLGTLAIVLRLCG